MRDRRHADGESEPLIVLFQRFVPHYREAAFAALSGALHGRLLVGHGDTPGSTVSGHANYRAVPCRYVELLGGRLFLQDYRPGLRADPRPSAVVVEHNPRILTNVGLLSWCRRNGVPAVLWGHGGSRRRRVSTSADWRDAVHRRQLRRAAAYVSYSARTAEEVGAVIGAERTFVAPNTLDMGQLAQLRRALEREGRPAVRQRLDLPCARYLIFIGRLLPEKRPALLVDVLGTLRARGFDFGAIFVGDGPAREHLAAAASRFPRRTVVLTGALNAWEESAPWLYASDALMVPAHIGLAVNHGFAFGLPVITAETPPGEPAHGPEIDYVAQGETGYIAPDASPERLAEGVLEMTAESPRRRYEICRFAERELGMERFVAGFTGALDFVRRSGPAA